MSNSKRTSRKVPERHCRCLLRATHCERCAVTCTDQETGQRSKEPLATLASYRRRENGYAGGVMFGAYMAVEGSATIRIGDELRVS